MNFKKMSIFHRGGAEDDYEQEVQSSGGVLAVWGSPGSGKTVTAVKLAKALADKKRNVALVLCDMTAPMLPCICPGSELECERSLGTILAAARIPVELFKLSVSLQASLTSGITGYGSGIDTLAMGIIDSLNTAGSLDSVTSSGIFGGLGAITSPIMVLFIIIMMGYSVIKVFFANLKRGGILLIQIAVGSLYMFSVPRGYMDGFTQWIKQIIGLCLTTFLQATILVAGLMVIPEHCLLGLGLMLAAGEVPRIAGAFGLDTSTRANIMSAVYTAQAAVNTTRTIVQSVPK